MAIFGRRRNQDDEVDFSDPWPSGQQQAETARYGRRSVDRELPENIVSMMKTFGQFDFNPMGAEIDAGSVWRNLVAPMVPFAQADPTGFVRALAAALLPIGGWAVYGGSHLVKELLSGDYADPNADSMITAALDFLRANGVPNLHLNHYESMFWASHKGATEPWLVAKPVPAPDAAPITDVAVGQLRWLAQLGAESDSNTFYVRQNRDGTYTAVVDAKWSDDDPRRVQRDWQSADALHGLYLAVANSLQVPPPRYDPELGPYFPYPSPTINWLPGPAS